MHTPHLSTVRLLREYGSLHVMFISRHIGETCDDVRAILKTLMEKGVVSIEGDMAKLTV